MARSNKADEKQLKQIEKAVAKADEAAKKAAKEAAREAKAAKAEARKEHGVDKIENKDKKFWEKQNITILKQQAELRGHRFNDLETKGGNTTINGVKTKFKKFKKEDYLQVLFKILKL
jgi:hypothetical protein